MLPAEGAQSAGNPHSITTSRRLTKNPHVCFSQVITGRLFFCIFLECLWSYSKKIPKSIVSGESGEGRVVAVAARMALI